MSLQVRRRCLLREASVNQEQSCHSQTSNSPPIKHDRPGCPQEQLYPAVPAEKRTPRTACRAVRGVSFLSRLELARQGRRSSKNHLESKLCLERCAGQAADLS